MLNDMFDWSLFSLLERSEKPVCIRLVDARRSKYIRMVLSERSRSSDSRRPPNRRGLRRSDLEVGTRERSGWRPVTWHQPFRRFAFVSEADGENVATLQKEGCKKQPSVSTPSPFCCAPRIEAKCRRNDDVSC
ncbi:hypothetical protein ANAPC5_01409 [Anaplasma phagocytophilum]|nr:hypothetical protein ANAPC5_01409 [Anaplasma phagocytophilum]